MKCPKCNGDMERYEQECDESELKEVWSCPWCGLWIDKRVPCTCVLCTKEVKWNTKSS